jgi:hypothetical protein
MGAGQDPVNGLALVAQLDCLPSPRQPGQSERMPPEIEACLPLGLHPVSRMFLEALLAGRITQQDFLWAFHLPNSDYLPVAECIVKTLSNLPNTNPALHL